MGYKCCVPSCGLRLATMHKFPAKHTRRFRKWALAVRNPTLYRVSAENVDKCFQVCCRHFSADQWEKLPDGKMRLHRHAVPNINLGKVKSHKSDENLQESQSTYSELIKKKISSTPNAQYFLEPLISNKYEPLTVSVSGEKVEFIKIAQSVQETPVLDDNIIILPDEPIREVDYNMACLMAWLDYSEYYPRDTIGKTIVKCNKVQEDSEDICGICLADLPNTGNLRMDTDIATNGSCKVYNILERVSEFKYSETGAQFVCSSCFYNVITIHYFQMMCNNAETMYNMSMKRRQVLFEHKYCSESSEIGKNAASDVAKQQAEASNIFCIETDAKGQHVIKYVNDKTAKIVQRMDDENDNDETTENFDASETEQPTSILEDLLTGGNNGLPQKQVPRPREMVKRKLARPLAYSCNYCDKKFRTLARAGDHERVVHTKEKPYKCPRCDKRYSVKGSLSAHILTHERQTVACEQCGRVCASEKTLQLHMKRHTEKKSPVLCQTCGKVFASINALNLHMSWHKRSTNVTGYTCKYCNMKFRLKYPWLEHVEQHEQIPKYKCKVCDKIFCTYGSHKKHENKHKYDGMTYQCPQCDKVFNAKSKLTLHLPVHSDERPLLCKYCGKTFRLRNCLKSHLKIHTRRNLHRCELCGKEFIERRAWRLHLRRIHGVFNPTPAVEISAKEEVHEAASAAFNLDNTVQQDYFTEILS